MFSLTHLESSRPPMTFLAPWQHGQAFPVRRKALWSPHTPPPSSCSHVGESSVAGSHICHERISHFPQLKMHGPLLSQHRIRRP